MLSLPTSDKHTKGDPENTKGDPENRGLQLKELPAVDSL